MTKTPILAGALMLSATLLAGCSAAGDAPQASPTPTVTRSATPTLKVPSKTEDNSVRLIVNGGKLKAGTVATIYRFDSEYGRKVSCNDPQANQQQVTIGGDGTDQNVTFSVPSSGVANWVLVAGKFITTCGAANARTTVLSETEARIFLSQDRDIDEPLRLGKAETLTVSTAPVPRGATAKASISVLGPYDTLPAALAANCETAKPVWMGAASLEYNNGRDVEESVKYTPKEVGVYVVNVEIPETAQTAEFNTCEAGISGTGGSAAVVPTTFSVDK